MAVPQYIGGFFGLESCGVHGAAYHSDAIALSTGRACFSLILEMLKPQKVFVPFYSCDALYEPLKGRCEFSFYSVAENFVIEKLPELQADEYLLYIDYFGLKGRYVEELKRLYGQKLIIDDTHNFFSMGHSGHWSFCSARKYFGVPDGAYLYSPISIARQFERNTDIEMDHLVNRVKGHQDLAFEQYQQYEKSLDCSIRSISLTSEKILDRVDYEFVKKARMNNFQFLESELTDMNLLPIPSDINEGFCYPLILERDIPKQVFHENAIFIPTLWPDVLNRKEPGFSTAKELTMKIIPIPVDHRYRPDDLIKVTRLIKKMTSFDE